MPIQVLMPALSPTMKEGNLVRWLKKEGDALKAGDVMAEIETDKATMEVEVVDEGILARIVVPAGTNNVAVNSVIALVAEDGEDVALVAASSLSPVSSPASVSPPPTAPAPVAFRPTTQKEERILATPLARRIAQQQGINLATLQGSGPRGRIILADVEKKAPPSPAEGFIDKPLSTVRKVIARRLCESKQTVPHFYLNIQVELDALLAARKALNETIADHKLTVNDFVIKAAALALKAVPDANVSWMEDAMRYYATSDIAVAVATEEGLITPIIRNADTKDMVTLSREMKVLAERARTTGLKPHEFQGGSFSISNLGMYGIDEFAAIINPPQAAILAVGAGRPTPIVHEGTIRIATLMACTLSVDHRAIDGKVGALWLQAFKKYIENPILMWA